MSQAKVIQMQPRQIAVRVIHEAQRKVVQMPVRPQILRRAA